jgi:glycosyltransferase involved in cell wall biosynthesis
MRILHLDGGKELRGGQWQVLRLIEGLTSAGVESTLLARKGAPLFRAAQEKGWHVEPLGIANTILAAHKYDLLHAHDGHGHKCGALAAGNKLVVSRRVAFPVRSRIKYARARHFLAISEFVKQVLEDAGVPGEKISVVYDGVPLLNPSRGVLVMASASSDAQKGTALALEAARLAGVDLKLSDNLERQLPGAGLFVYLTYSEGLGSGALLAMSAGLPVIASKVGGLPEVIQHGQNGFLVENDAQEVANAIHLVLADGKLAQRIGAAARQTIIEKFTVDHMVRRTMEIYKQEIYRRETHRQVLS